MIFVFFFLSLSLVSAASNSTCEDSDKGVNYNNKGTAKGNWYKNLTQVVEYADSCAEEGGKLLNEYYCDESAVAVVKYNCPVACENGVCVKELSPSQVCEDSDTSDSFRKGSTSAKTFNASWSKGTLIILNATTARQDYCVKTISPAENLGECIGIDCSVVEITCAQVGRNNIGQMTPTPCQHGCKEGACLKEAPKPVEVPKPECNTTGILNGTRYCSSDQKWVEQKALKSTCIQNYECISNLCTEKVCEEPAKPNFFAKIWNWIKGLFGK